MYGLTTGKESNGRGARAHTPAMVALAALVILSLPAARAQIRPANTYGGLTQVSGGILNIRPGQTLRLTVPASIRLQDGSVRFVRNTVSVYDAGLNLIYQTDGDETQHEVGHLLGLGRIDVSGADINDLFIFRRAEDPSKVLIEVQSSVAFPSPLSREQAQELAANLYTPTLELVGDADGKTTAWGTLTKVGAGTLTLSGGSSTL